MTGNPHDIEARLDQIRRELARQNETLAELAPELAPAGPAPSREAARPRAHLAMRRV